MCTREKNFVFVIHLSEKNRATNKKMEQRGKES